MGVSGDFKRYSKGPLYSASELRQVEDALARDGYGRVEDNKVLGMRIYNKAFGGQQLGTACIYLDETGCHPNNSGTMMISDAGGTHVTTVWEYAKQKRAETATNPVMKLLRRMF